MGKYKPCLEHRETREALFSSLSLPVHKHLCTHTREQRLVEQAGLHPVTVVSLSLILGTLSLALGAEANLSPGENQVFGFPRCLHPLLSIQALQPCTHPHCWDLVH